MRFFLCSNEHDLCNLIAHQTMYRFSFEHVHLNVRRINLTFGLTGVSVKYMMNGLLMKKGFERLLAC